jgi:hypothetical protein
MQENWNVQNNNATFAAENAKSLVADDRLSPNTRMSRASLRSRA